MKNHLLNILSAALIGIFLIISCSNNDFAVSNESIEGNGHIKSETRKVSDFENISISNLFDVTLKQGAYKLTIEAEADVLDHLVSEVKNNTLILRKKRGVRLKTKKTPKIYLSMPNLRGINISGAGSLRSKGAFDAENIEIHISGSAKMDLNFDCESLSANLSGAADINLRGTAERFSASTSGAGDIDARDFITKSSIVHVSGAGAVKVNATDLLKANISGAGSVKYVGSPKEIKKNVSGMGVIKSI